YKWFNGFEYKIIQNVVIGGGLSVEHATISDFELRQHYTLIGIPIYLKHDGSDDLLNPTTGDREAIAITPYTDPGRTSLSFIAARYYTGLGPLRFDIAAPLHRRSGDRPFQIYVSLGQAF